MTAPLDVTGAQIEAQPEAGLAGVEATAVEGRSLGQIAWIRLKRDKVALAGGVVVILLILVAIFAPLIVKLLGHPPNEFHQDSSSTPSLQTPRGSFGGISWDFLFGVEPVERPRHLQPDRLRRPDLAADRVPRHAAVGGHRHRRSA